MASSHHVSIQTFRSAVAADDLQLSYGGFVSLACQPIFSTFAPLDCNASMDYRSGRIIVCGITVICMTLMPHQSPETPLAGRSAIAVHAARKDGSACYVRPL